MPQVIEMHNMITLFLVQQDKIGSKEEVMSDILKTERAGCCKIGGAANG